MSYAFNVRGATREEVMGQVVAELDKVVASQPIHEADRASAEEVVKSFINLVEEDEDLDYYVSVSGSVSYKGDQSITGANVNVGVRLVDKDAS